MMKRLREETSTMTRIMKSSIRLTLASMLVTMVLAGSAAAQKVVPFQGSIHGTDADSFDGLPPGFVTVTTVGSGIATHLGNFSATWKLLVNESDFTATGSFHAIAANGDEIYTIVAASAEPTDTPGVVRVTEIHTITGGTGRFTNAIGSFIMDILRDGTTFAASGSFRGVIFSTK
jgi:hypothetical protein